MNTPSPSTNPERCSPPLRPRKLLGGLLLFAITLLFAQSSFAAVAFRAATSASASGGVSVITHVATGSTANAANGDVTPTLPAGIQSGDLLLCLVESHDTVQPSAPSGWSSVYSLTGTAHRASLFYKIANTPESNPLITHSGGNSIIAQCSAFRGINQAIPFDVVYTNTNAQYTASGLQINTGTLTTLTQGSLPLFAAHINNNPSNLSVTTTGGLTWSQSFYSRTGSGLDSGIGLFYAAQPAPGAIGPLQATANNQPGESHGVLLALRPAAPNTLTISTPTGTITNDAMIATIAIRPCSNTSGGACTTTLTAPAGWTQVRGIDTPTGGGTGGYGSRHFVYRRTGTAPEPANYTWSIGGNPAHAGAVGGILSFSGVDPTNPVVAEAGQTTANAYTHTAPSIDTGTVTGTMLVSSHSSNSSGTWTPPPPPPTGMTERIDIPSLAVPDVLGISIETNTELRTASGVTGTRTATISNPPTSDTGAAHMLALRPTIIAALDHFTLTVGGSASTCTPQTVTITAYDASNIILKSYTGTVSITTSTNHGDWSDTVMPTTLNNGTIDDGAATYAFVGGDSGTKELQLTNDHADNLTITVQDGTATATSATVTFSDNAFVITPTTSTGGVANSTELVAGRNHNFKIEMWRKNPGGNCNIASGYNGTKNLDGWITRDTLDPNGTAPTIGAVSLPSSAPAVSAASNNLTNINFTNGTATITISTTDVGKYMLNLRDDTRSFAGATNIGGASDVLIVRPFGLGFTNINKSGTSNPGGTASSGNAFVAAGDTFSATVGGYLWALADDTLNDGIPDAGATITDNGLTPSFAYSTALVSAIHTPASGSSGTLSGTTTIPQANFSGGKTTISDLAWNQVGSLYLDATTTSYLGVVGVNVTGRSSSIGRVYPHHFSVASSSVTAACNGFTYMDQPKLQIAYTLQAEKLGNGVTSNYDNNTLGYTLVATPALAAENNNAGVNLASRIITSSSPKWTTGQYIFNDSSAKFVRATPPAPDGPYDILQLGVNTSGGDAVLIQNLDMRATTTGNCTTIPNCDAKQLGTATKMRYGRLRPLNAYGPETGTIIMPVHMEYYTGTAFVRNVLDNNCTTLSSPADCTVGTGNYTLFNTVGSTPACTIVIGTGTATTTLSVIKTQSTDLSPGIAKEGIAKLSFTPTTPPAPPAGKTNTGYADLTALITSSLPWLLYEWDGLHTTYNENPAGRANFGIYRGNDRIINWREIIR
ncbi:MAG: hypothetical protein NTW42_01060 [Deltaproteobacteria bacterium]|nr:hypothetical protein [Deltaproteobacteria bacterium]